MANLKEQNVWEAGIYQIETSDPVVGGPDGVDNLPLRQLTNRTLWLKNQIAAAVQSIGVNKQWAAAELAKKADKTINMVAGAGLTGGGTLAANRTFTLARPSTLSGSTANWAGNGATGHTHELAAASPTLAGVLKVLNVLNSSDGLSALSAQQGKVLAEMINKVAAGAFNFCGALGTKNLNDIDGGNPANYGVWYQSANVEAKSERGYPSEKAGVMLMVPAAYRGMQIYIPFDQNRIYKRTTGQIAVNYAYQPWQELGSDKLGDSGAQKLTGTLEVANNNWSKLVFPVLGGSWRLEFQPDSSIDRRLNFVFSPDVGNPSYLRFEDIGSGETVAYKSWVNAGLSGKVSRTGAEEISGVKSFKDSVEFAYRAVIRRNSPGFTPYLVITDESVNLSGTISAETTIGEITMRAGETGQSDGRTKGMLRTRLLPNKNAYVEIWSYDASNSAKNHMRGFSETGNTRFGGGADNGLAPLQSAGDVAANGSFTALATWPKVQLCSTQGDQALLLENGGASGQHRFIVRRHVNGVVQSGNIALFSLPNKTGAHTLATTGDVDEAIAKKSTVSVITGTIADGGTLPLPSGYTAAQCKWMVSINQDNPGLAEWTVNEDDSRDFAAVMCSVDGNRKVTARLNTGTSGNRTASWASGNIISGTANYIVIGVK